MSGDAAFVKAPLVWVPGLYGARRAIYLAGSIEGTDWREEMLPFLRAGAGGDRFAILSPRRFRAASDLYAARQMEWESDHLSRAERVAFWFQTGAPSEEAFFQLRDTLHSSRMAIGVEAGHPLEPFVRFVVSRMRPDVEIVHNLPALADAVLRAKRGRAWRSPSR